MGVVYSLGLMGEVSYLTDDRVTGRVASLHKDLSSRGVVGISGVVGTI